MSARILGGTGLIPFLVPVVMLWVGPSAWQHWAWASLQNYGAVILSFLGAVHWGAALHETDTAQLWWRLGWSVSPALLAWIALALSPAAGILLLGIGFIVQYIADRRAVHRGLMPQWYLRLRGWLTMGVMITVSLALLTWI